MRCEKSGNPDGSLVDNILLAGSYSNNDFWKAMDSGTGTLKFV